ncbi:MAG: hypothetical protein JXA44_04385 [Methanospirillaceae archaeon]|nr:hypothetical protein [Methanospirillaceae archaeon]
MNPPTIFIDTSIFFTCAEDMRSRTIMQHAKNAGYAIQTSISVPGEAFIQMHEHEKALDYITSMNQLLDEWNITVLFPNDSVRILCFRMGEEEIDTRMIREPVDRTHLAYAIAYQSDSFLTSDKNLIRYRIPSSLEEIGFSKPTCKPLEEFRNEMLMKVCDISNAYEP